jgi:two-component system, cell cycle sensor histidine kinase and response regulator CckA
LPMSDDTVPRLAVNTPQPLSVGGGGTVLLVEDEEMLREMAATMLTRMGYKVRTAKDGVEALEIFKNHLDEIRVVLSDLSMPRMGGWETLTALRKIRPDVPVILASGHDESTVLAGDHPERPQVVLHKPYQMSELQAALARAVRVAV